MSLLETIASAENLYLAFQECSRGKRSKLGYQKFLFASGERLVGIRKRLLSGTFVWQGYRSFTVKEPKPRVVMAAPFCDRVVHHAIHRVIEPLFDKLMSESAYACRKNKGTSKAVCDLWAALRSMGTQRYVIKLDVKNFFATIPHEILLQSLTPHGLFAQLPDQSINSLILALFASHDIDKRGIPIGNLTSQLFANWILTPADKFIETQYPQVRHFRYMDDFVLLARNKKDALDCAHAVIAFVKNELQLDIPFTKTIPLGSDPVPFLGYLLSHDSY